MQQIGEEVSQNKGIQKLLKKHKMGDCCCGCLSTSTGVKIIGAGLALSFLEELSHPNLVRFLLKLAVLIPFVLAFVRDCA